MKKRLESELISIAHRILKLKNKSELDQLYKETQKVYETLTVLKFYQDNYESVKADVTQEELEEKLTQAADRIEPMAVVAPVTETIIEESEAPETETAPIVEQPEEINVSVEEEESAVEEEEATEETITTEEAPEEETKEKEDAFAFKPIFELEAEAEETEEQMEPAEVASEITPETKKGTIETFLGEDYTDPVFVKPNEVSLFSTETSQEEPKSVAWNEALSKSIAIGLNDRIGFVKHLFGDSSEDFNRVLSQLNTFDTFEEAKNFIEDMIKPDYNNWEGEEEYEERFMEVVEHKFK